MGLNGLGLAKDGVYNPVGVGILGGHDPGRRFACPGLRNETPLGFMLRGGGRPEPAGATRPRRQRRSRLAVSRCPVPSRRCLFDNESRPPSTPAFGGAASGIPTGFNSEAQDKRSAVLGRGTATTQPQRGCIGSGRICRVRRGGRGIGRATSTTRRTARALVEADPCPMGQ
jgi:hypothetical protein